MERLFWVAKSKKVAFFKKGFMFIKWKKPSLTNKIVKKRDSKDRYPSIYNFCLHFSKPGLTIFTVRLSIKKGLKSGKIAN